MSNESLGKLGDKIAGQTGVTPAEQAGAAGAQVAAEQTITSATGFAADQMAAVMPAREPDRKPHGITIVSPYGESELSEKEELLKKAGIEFRQDIYQEHKSHLLSALTLASQIGIDQNEALRALNDHIEQEKKRLPYLAHSGISYELGSYLIEEYIVRKMAQRKNLEAPESFKPADGRKSFMVALAGSLEETEKQHLAQYVASTQAGYSISPFYSPLSFEVTNREGLRRQNIAVAIAPQPFEQDLIKSFLSQEGIRKENFLLAMANSHLRESMPFGALLAGEYRVTLQYSPSDRREVSMREALEEQIGRSYTERSVGSEPKGLLPFEELAGRVVVDNFKNLAQEDLESRFAQIIPQVLQAEQPLVKLEEVFPDMKLFYDRSEIDRLTTDIDALKEATAHPDQVPPRNFWYRAFTMSDKTFGFFTQVRDGLIQRMYQTGGESHLHRWREVADGFAVSEGQDRNGELLKLTLVNNHEVGVSGKDGPQYSLVKREDGKWYPTSYRYKKSQKPVFGIEGMSYEELQRQIAASPFQYQIERDFLREILRGSLNDLATNVYGQIKTQCDLEAIQDAGFYPSHAAIAYREENPLKDFQYLIGSMTPYGVGIYDSIFSAFTRHLWQHQKLAETDLSVAVPLTGQSVTARHPLLELPSLSFEEIQKRLKETNTDVRVPEITIRKSGGHELRAKAWVYKNLLKLKEIGFDAVLGKTMAEEFNRQAARIYVEGALTDLSFLPEDYQREKPLTALQNRQQAIYSKALELDFTIPLEYGYHLGRSLSLPLTWEKEKELVKFLEGKLAQGKLQEFYNEIGVNDDYFETRDIVETFLDFASGWQWNQFDRSNEFPTYTYQSSRSEWGSDSGTRSLLSTKSAGEYAVSTQAQEKFKAAKKTWGEFLDEVQQRGLRLVGTPFKQKIDAIGDLGSGLVTEIDKMSQAEVTQWAEKIIKGEMAAVGRDMQRPIDVKTWTDFHEAIRQLMDTARLVLIYRSEKGRFGWEVSTDKEELS